MFVVLKIIATIASAAMTLSSVIPGSSSPTVIYAPHTSVIQAQGHVQNIGWMDTVSGSEVTIGTTGRALRLEAVRFKLSDFNNAKIDYSVLIPTYGWLSSTNFQPAGTTGLSLPIQQFKMELIGNSSYRLEYRVHIENTGWTSWQRSGTVAGTIGKRIEAINVRLVPN